MYIAVLYLDSGLRGLTSAADTRGHHQLAVHGRRTRFASPCHSYEGTARVSIAASCHLCLLLFNHLDSPPWWSGWLLRCSSVGAARLRMRKKLWPRHFFPCCPLHSQLPSRQRPSGDSAISTMDLSKATTSDLMAEIQRRVRCAEQPERRAVLIGAWPIATAHAAPPPQRLRARALRGGAPSKRALIDVKMHAATYSVGSLRLLSGSKARSCGLPRTGASALGRFLCDRTDRFLA